MDRNPDESSDKQANMDLRSKIAYFNSVNKAKQSSQKETDAQESSHQVQKSVSASSCEMSDSSSKTKNTYRPLTTLRDVEESFKQPNVNASRSTFQPKEPTKWNDEQQSSANASRINQNELRADLERAVSSRKKREWCPTDMEIFQRPMCLISTESIENGNGEEARIILKKEEKAFEQLEMIDWPMVIVAVVGLYRTGKSYLMNRLADSSKGFALGDTIESTTKGIWAWCKIHPERSNTVLMLLDTEGLGDVEKGDPSHDNKIFTLATLLSNCLVYNMKGAFDNDAVTKLTFVTEMANNIRFRGEASEDNKTLNLILPDFVLCLRDFSLKLQKGQRKLSENEYLEESLAENKTKADPFNKPRECIRKYFGTRECFAFPVPGDGDVLENLEQLKFNDLSDRFKKTTTRFVSYIYSKPPKELLASKPVNGQMFVILVDRYVTAIKHGAVPDVDDAFTAVAKVENAKMEKEAVEIFESQLREMKLPVSQNVLRDFYTEVQDKALNYLRTNVVLDKNAHYEQQAKIKMDAVWMKVKEDNDRKVLEKCEKKVQEGYEKYFEEKIENGEYEKAGGYRRFQRDFERLKEEYTSVLRDFDEHEILWTWHGFVKRMKDTERKIVEADENFSLKEKEEEQMRNQENIERLLKEQQKAQEEALEKQKQHLQDHYKMLEESSIKQMQIENEKYKALVKEKLDKEEAQKELERFKREEEERKKGWVGKRIWKALWND